MSPLSISFSRSKIVGILAGLVLAAMPASASVTIVTSLPGGVALPIPAVNQLTEGPVTAGPAVFTSNVPGGSLFGWTGGYVFGNGTIPPGSAPILALNAGDIGGAYYNPGAHYATMSLSFDAPITGFLAHLNWTNGASGGFSTSIAAYNSAGTILGVYQLNNNDSYNGVQPGYYGFSSTEADIARIDFNNGYLGVSDITVTGATFASSNSPAPELATWALMVVGMGLVGATLRGSRGELAFAR